MSDSEHERLTVGVPEKNATQMSWIRVRTGENPYSLKCYESLCWSVSDDDVATDENVFWERRHHLSLSPISDEDVEQRGIGRDRHLVLLAHLHDSDLITSVRPLLERLGQFGCFEPVPAENLHITIKVLGNVVESPSNEAEFTQTEERDLAAALGSVLDDCSPFDVELPRFNLFPDTVYAEVDDEGRFRELNRRVCELSNVPVWDRDRAGFIPHLTLGHFTQRGGYEELVEYLESNRRLDLPTTSIELVKFVAVNLTEGRIPPYETIQAYPLD